MSIKKQCITSPRSKKTTNDSLITIVFLCDSPGYRMKSYGAIPLIPFKTKRLIDIQINAIKSVFKNFEIVLCVGYDSDRVCKYVKNKYRNINIRIIENQIFDKSNSCESVRLCLNNINNEKVIICDGSLIIDSKTFKSLSGGQSSYVMTEIDKNDDLEIGVNTGSKNFAEHFGFGAYYTWSEIIFLNSYETIEYLRKIISNDNYKQRFLFEAFNELIKTKHNIEVVQNMHPVQKINNVKTYHRLRDCL